MAKYTITNFLKTTFPITQFYGENPDFYRQFGLPGHEGVDYGTPVSTPLYAPFGGVIVRDGINDKDYGNFLVVWDPIQNCALWFCHLQSVTVNMNDRVTVGQLIGYTGNTGNTTGPHLHVNFVETDPDGIRLNKSNGYQGFLNLLDGALVQINEFATPSIPQSAPVAVEPIAPPPAAVPTVEVSAQLPTPEPPSPQVPDQSSQLTEMIAQRDEAIAQAKEATDKYTVDLANYSALVSGGYPTIGDVQNALKAVTYENTGLKKQLVEVLQRNEAYHLDMAAKEKEDATAIEVGMKAEDELRALKSDFQVIAHAHGVRPTLNAILAEVEKLKRMYGRAMSLARKVEVKQLKTQTTETVSVTTPRPSLIGSLFGFTKKGV